MSARCRPARRRSDRLLSARVRRAFRLLAASALRRFVRQERATSSIEFAMLAAPFFAVTVGVIQTAMVFFASQSLETAAAVAGRLIMTGQAQIQGWTAAQFKQQVCNQVQAIFNCSSGVYIDVESYSSFAAVNLGLPITNGVFNSSSLSYNPGGPGDVVVVRLYYQYPLYYNVPGLSNLTGNMDLFAATAVFQNEPYSSTS